MNEGDGVDVTQERGVRVAAEGRRIKGRGIQVPRRGESRLAAHGSCRKRGRRPKCGESEKSVTRLWKGARIRAAPLADPARWPRALRIV